MDIEKLTKSQIVLLTLLVSFVTSIATGIVTVSLVDQAPPAITQSVSRIIRETVQSAVPATVGQPAAVALPKVEPPPAVPSLANRIANADHSVVRLYSGPTDSPVFLGLGVVLDKKGTVVTDADAIGTLQAASATLANGSSTPMVATVRDPMNGFVYLEPAASTTDMLFVPATLASSQPLVGDTVIAFADKSDLRIASGIVVSLPDAPQKEIATNVPANSIIKGSPIINDIGQFLGISTGVVRLVDASSFVPISAVVPQGALQAEAP